MGRRRVFLVVWQKGVWRKRERERLHYVYCSINLSPPEADDADDADDDADDANDADDADANSSFLCFSPPSSSCARTPWE